MLVADQIHTAWVPLKFSTKLLNPLIKLVERVGFRFKCSLTDDTVRPKRFWKVSSLEQVRSLEYRLETIAAFVLHDLIHNILVDLAEATIKHFSSFKHVENSIAKYVLTMDSAINIEKKFRVAKCSINWNALTVLQVKG